LAYKNNYTFYENGRKNKYIRIKYLGQLILYLL